MALGIGVLLKSNADFRFWGPECLLNVFWATQMSHRSFAVFLCLLKREYFLSLIYTLPVPCAAVCPWKLKRPAQHSLVTLLSLLCAYPNETLVKTTHKQKSNVHVGSTCFVSGCQPHVREKVWFPFLPVRILCIPDGQKLWNKTTPLRVNLVVCVLIKAWILSWNIA